MSRELTPVGPHSSGVSGVSSQRARDGFSRPPSLHYLSHKQSGPPTYYIIVLKLLETLPLGVK